MKTHLISLNALLLLACLASFAPASSAAEAEEGFKSLFNGKDLIGSALRRCDWFMLLLSPAAVNSIWVKRELLFALQQPRYENRITPLVLAPCDFEQLSWTLSAFQMIGFDKDFDVGCRNLLRIWGIGYQKLMT